jgi:hypothetical protein
MPSPQAPISSSAVGWALLSQAIWLPLVAIEAHDQWKDHVRQQTPPRSLVARTPDAEPGTFRKEAAISSLIQGSSAGTTTGLVLGTATPSADPLLNDPIQRSIEQGTTGSLAMLSPSRRISPSMSRRSLDRPLPAAIPGFTVASSSDRTVGESLLQRSFTRAELLGGPITLSEPDTVTMPALARAERARWASSGDPLAPLPEVWRAPMRHAIEQLPSPPTGSSQPRSPKIQLARVVHVPSRRVSKPTDVPVALQSDGTVDILSKPEDPAVVEEIDSWSLRQQAPSAGSVSPAVVHIHPLADAPAAPPADVSASVSSPPPEAPAQVPSSVSSSTRCHEHEEASMKRIRSVSFLAAQLLFPLALPISLRAQAFSDPTTRWQPAPSDGRLIGWQFVANPRSLPAEFLPVPAPTASSQQIARPLPSSP